MLMASEQSTDSDKLKSEEKLIPKEQDSKVIISKYTGWAAGSGAIPFPIWDIAATAAIQVKMVKELLDQYGKSFSESKTRSIITILIGSLSPQLLLGATASTLFKFVPGIGHVLASISLPILAAASTYAVGKVISSHLENGGDLSNFDAHSVTDNFKSAFDSEAAKQTKQTQKAK
jgi:uncharacterized protein (DUF697 family)